MLRGYALGAVDFLFKPIVPEILRSKAQVFVDLQRKTQELRRQARLIREAEAREHARRLGEERQRWEADTCASRWSASARAAAEMARKAEELARAVADRDDAARALMQSNARLALLSDTANRLLTGQRPHELARRAVRAADRATSISTSTPIASSTSDGTTLMLQAGRLSTRTRERYCTSAISIERRGGKIAETRTRCIIDERNADERCARERLTRVRHQRLRLLSAAAASGSSARSRSERGGAAASRSRSWR